jgi:CDP-2,3-bis-(O-geranylgeranyl)-sn-glycerol synthase
VWWHHVLHALWLFLPAFVANMSPVFTAKLVPSWKQPIDGGRIHKDGRRVLGDGKTWRGLTGGALTGGLTAVALGLLAGGLFAEQDFGRSLGAHPITIFLFGAIVGFMALVGDAVESYAKRRLGKARGDAWIPFDQLDFVVFGLLGAVLAAPLLPGWAMQAYFGHWLVVATLIVGTPVLHLSVNRIGYWLKLKEVPW